MTIFRTSTYLSAVMAPQKGSFTQDSRDPAPSNDEKISESAPTLPSRQHTVLLKLTTSGHFHRKLHINHQSDKEIYHCKSQMISKPHLSVLASGTNSGERNAEVAKITHSPFKNTFEMVLNGQEVRVDYSGVFKSTYSFRSPHLRP